MLYLVSGEEKFIEKVVLQRGCKVYTEVESPIVLKDILKDYIGRSNLAFLFTLSSLSFNQREECLSMLAEESNKETDIYLVERDLYFLLYTQYLIARNSKEFEIYIKNDPTFRGYFSTIQGLHMRGTDIIEIDFSTKGKPSRDVTGFFTEEVELQNRIIKVIY